MRRLRLFDPRDLGSKNQHGILARLWIQGLARAPAVADQIEAAAPTWHLSRVIPDATAHGGAAPQRAEYAAGRVVRETD